MNKKIILFSLFIFSFLLIFSSISSANDNLNQSIASQESSTIEKTVNDMNNENIKNTEKISKTVSLNSTNFNEYVTDRKLNDNISEGDTIDIQGKLEGSEFTLEVNKPVNIISSNGDAYINAKTSSFIVTMNGSGSNITDISFYNTRISIENVTNLHINNITMLAETPIGNGVGSFSIRNDSVNVTVTNSSFTNAGTQHSVVVFAGASNILFENNIVEGIDSSGNLLYATSYGATSDNENIIIRNNTIRSNIHSAICYGLTLQGSGFLIENNYFDTDTPVMGQWSDPDYGVETIVNDIIFNNNTVVRYTPQLVFPGIVANNTFGGSVVLKNNYAYNNIFNDVTIMGNELFENNTVNTITIDGNNNIIGNFSSKTISLNGNNNTLRNISDVESFSLTGSNNTFTNLSINTNSTIEINGNNNTVKENQIINNQTFAINIVGTNNNISNNYIKSKTLNGNNAIKNFDSENIIENNNPSGGAELITITNDNYSNYFNEDGKYNTTIQNDSIIIIKGDFQDKDFILEDFCYDLILLNSSFYNSTVTINSTSSFNLNSLNINNRNSEKKNALIIYSENNIIKSLKINDNGNKDNYQEIILEGNNNIISGEIDLYSDENLSENPNGIITLIKSENNQINLNSYLRNKLDNCTAMILTSNSKNNTINNGYSFVYSQGSNLTGIIISGTGNIINQTRIYQQQDFGRSLILDNANNSIIYGSYGIYAYNEAIILINSHNNIINDINAISSSKSSAIVLINSTNNTIENCNSIISTQEYTINLTNSSNNNIQNNYITNNQQYGGNNAILLDENSNENQLLNNSNTLVYLNDDTYEQLFTDNVLNQGNIIEINGDLHNKTMIFNNAVTINGNYYTLYNSPIIVNNSYNYQSIHMINFPMLKSNINKNTTINNLKIETDEISTVLEINKNTTLNNIEIKQVNTINTHIETIVVNKEDLNINNVKINISSENDVIAITDHNSSSTYQNLQLNIKGNKVTALNLDNMHKEIKGLTITINGTNVIALKINNTQNQSISNNNINITSDNGQLIYLANSSNIKIQNNKLNSTANQKGIIIENSENINFTDNTIENDEYYGDLSVESINNSNIIVKSNLPKLYIILTDENYDNYFENSTSIGDYEIIKLGSDIYNKDLIITRSIVFYGNNYTIYNGTINLSQSSTIQDTIINNTNKQALIVNTYDVVSNNIIYYQGNDEEENDTIDDNKGIILINNYATVSNNIIYFDGNNKEVIYLVNCTMNNANFINNQIEIKGNDNKVITVDNYKHNNNRFSNNNITVTGNNNIVLYHGNVTATSYFNKNNITVYTNISSTPIVINNSKLYFDSNEVLVNTTQGENPIIKVITITTGRVNKNYIESLDLTGNDAVDTPGKNTGNTPTETGYKSKINIQLPEIFIIKQNNIITINPTDSFDQQINGTITLTDGEITTTTQTNQISYQPTTSGEKTLTITFTDPTGKYNSITTNIDITVKNPKLTIDNINAITGEKINLTARINIDNQTLTNINNGKVVFKVNGKTIKDNNGKVIYVKVVNGTATIENYEIPDSWAKDGITIEAVYSGSTQCESLRSDKQMMNITKAPPTFTTEDIITTQESTIILIANIIDGNKTINTGKVVFKINGKTLKDENGKVIYAKVVNNAVSVEYKLPSTYKNKSYNITATFISTEYNKLEDSKMLTITKI